MTDEHKILTIPMLVSKYQLIFTLYWVIEALVLSVYMYVVKVHAKERGRGRVVAMVYKYF